MKSDLNWVFWTWIWAATSQQTMSQLPQSWSKSKSASLFKLFAELLYESTDLLCFYEPFFAFSSSYISRLVGGSVLSLLRFAPWSSYWPSEERSPEFGGIVFSISSTWDPFWVFFLSGYSIRSSNLPVFSSWFSAISLIGNCISFAKSSCVSFRPIEWF